MAHTLKMESSIEDAGQVPHITTLVTGVGSGRVPVPDIELKFATFLRGAGYPVTRVTVETAEIPDNG